MKWTLCPFVLQLNGENVGDERIDRERKIKLLIALGETLDGLID